MTTAVTVLNASLEPLSTTTLSRAIHLVRAGQAEIQEADESRIVRSAELTYKWPLVIRMLRYIKVPFRVGPEHWSKSGVLKRDKYICGYCGRRADTVDHIHPQSRGGRDQWLNTVAACKMCNSLKADKLLEETDMVLNIEPTIPTRIYFTSKK